MTHEITLTHSVVKLVDFIAEHRTKKSKYLNGRFMNAMNSKKEQDFNYVIQFPNLEAKEEFQHQLSFLVNKAKNKRKELGYPQY